MSKTYRKNSFEAHIDSLIPTGKDSFRLIFHRLIRSREGGWEVNDSNYHNGVIDRDSLIEDVRGRWEIYKANYLKGREARVGNILDESSTNERLMLEINGQAFVDIEILD